MYIIKYFLSPFNSMVTFISSTGVSNKFAGQFY